MPDRPRLLPILSAMLACVLGGSALVATRFVIDETTPLALATLRYGGATVVILAIALAPLGRDIAVRRPGLGRVIMLGVLQFGLFGYFFTAALDYAPAARVALIFGTQPLMTLIVAAMLGRERMTLPKLAGAAVGLGGVALALGDDALQVGPEVWKGDALMFGAVLTGAVYNVFTGPLSRNFPALTMMAIQLPVGALALLAALLATGDASSLFGFSPSGWVVVLYLATFAGAACFYAWIWALERVAPSRVAITVTINPIAAALLAAPILGEPLTWRVVAGLVCVVSGIGLANWPMRRAAPASSTI